MVDRERLAGGRRDPQRTAVVGHFDDAVAHGFALRFAGRSIVEGRFVGRGRLRPFGSRRRGGAFHGRGRTLAGAPARHDEPHDDQHPHERSAHTQADEHRIG